MVGRRVRFQLDGGECCLNLCELQIYVCSPGWYGAMCDKSCLSDQCYNNSCDQQTGLCTKCNENFAGDHCSEGCSPGWYGASCDKRCLSDQCYQNSCDRPTGLCTKCNGTFAGEYCYLENIAPGKTYTISTNYSDFNVNSAANGNTSPIFPANCIHTKIGDNAGWWEVDLGTSFPVYSIKIWGRTGEVNRMYPFVITVDQMNCTANTSVIGSIELSVTCSSVMVGRRVRFQRTGGDCCLNLCELQIYVCIDGRYGPACNKTCSPPLCQRCHRLTGDCSACNESYNLSPPACTDCAEGYFRQNGTDGPCSKCAFCYNNTVCDKYTGNCDRCPPGKLRPTCVKDCDQYTYGQDCGQQCGQCQNNTPVTNRSCNPVTGVCAQCQPGYQLPYCTQECQNGAYGQNCSSTCGHCKNGAVCNKVSGQCPLCEPGWYEPDCHNSCANFWYGNNCSLRCGNCSNNASCNKTNGYCQSCNIGVQPPLCQSACQNNTHGPNCSQSCGQCLGDAACDPVSGQCSFVCGPGYVSSQDCKEVCQAGHYGDQCNQTCGQCSESACHHVTGLCEKGCAGGFTGNLCTQAVTQDTNTAGTIAGATVGCAASLIIAALVAALVVRWRRRSQLSGSHSTRCQVKCGETSELDAANSCPATANDLQADQTDVSHTHPETYSQLHPYANAQADRELYSVLGEPSNPYETLNVYSNDDSDQQPYTRLAAAAKPV